MAKVVEIIISEKIKSAKRSELPKLAKEYYIDYVSGKSIINAHKGFKISFTGQGQNKIAHGSALYAKKVATIKYLPEILENAVYSNFSHRKAKDPKELIGYLNFKGKCKIDGRIEYLRLACLFYSATKIFFNHEINIIKK